MFVKGVFSQRYLATKSVTMDPFYFDCCRDLVQNAEKVWPQFWPCFVPLCSSLHTRPRGFFFEVCLNNLFDWYWTGFKGNKLWVWLSMLLIPVVLTTATMWFTTPASRKKRAKEQSAETMAP